jgi:toxin ParE1/3/4
MGELFLTRQARQDIKEIGRFTQQRWGNDQRRRYLMLFSVTFEKLTQQSILGKPRNELKHGLLSYVCESHVIYFRRTACGVEILRILHQRMDACAHLVIASVTNPST